MQTASPEDASPSRRERRRAVTEAEIRAAARARLAADGRAAISLRGIARDMGMTAPALYRYFASLDELVDALCDEYFTEAAAAVGDAVGEVDGSAGDRLQVAVRAFHRWARTHPAEFELMFSADSGDGPVLGGQGARQFARHFLELLVTLDRDATTPPPGFESVPASACAQLAPFAREYGIELPDRALWALASLWARLYSAISMDVLGKLSFMFPDATEYVEHEIREVVRVLGVPYLPPEVSADAG